MTENITHDDSESTSNVPAIILIILAVAGIASGIVGLHSANSSRKAMEALQAKLDKQRGSTEQLENEIRLLAGKSQNALNVMSRELISLRDQITNQTARAQSPTAVKTGTGAAGSGQATAPQDPNGVYHVIKPGDLIGRVAKQYGTTMEKITELNPGLDPAHIKLGQKIRVK